MAGRSVMTPPSESKGAWWHLGLDAQGGQDARQSDIGLVYLLYQKLCAVQVLPSGTR